MNFSTLYCQIHHMELLINYCTAPECQVGLCPNCIGTHTNEHLKKGTRPEYENIRDTFQHLIKEIADAIEVMQNTKKRVVGIETKVREKKEKLREIIDISKKDVLKLVESVYETKERDLLLEIQNKDSQKGLHSEDRLRNLTILIEKECQNLKSAGERISTYNFAEAVQKTRWQYLVNAQHSLQDFQKEVKQNEQHITSISYDKGILSQISDMLSQIIKIQVGSELIMPIKHNFLNSLTSQEKPQKGYMGNMGYIGNINNKGNFNNIGNFGKIGISDVLSKKKPIDEKSQLPISEQLKKYQEVDENSSSDYTSSRPVRVESMSTVSYNWKDKGNQIQSNPSLVRNLNEQSQLTVDKNRSGSYQINILPLPDNYSLAQPLNYSKKTQGSFIDAIKQPKENNNTDYNFTFGSQVSQYNPFQTLSMTEKYLENIPEYVPERRSAGYLQEKNNTDNANRIYNRGSFKKF